MTCLAMVGALGSPVFAHAVPPNTEITAGPSGLTASKKATFEFSANRRGSTFECRLDVGQWQECESPWVITRLTQAAHVFRVRALKGGVVDPTPATRAFSVDTVAPDTTIVSGPEDLSDDYTPSFEFSSSEEGSTFECRLASGAFKPCATPFTQAPPLTDDTYTFEVRGRDAAGNADRSPSADEFTIESPLRQDFQTALEAHGLYFLPGPLDFDARASCGGSPEIDCVSGQELPPADQVRLDTTSLSLTQVPGQGFDVSFQASVETLAPIKVDFGGAQCDLTFDSSSGADPTWRTVYRLDFRSANQFIPAPYLEAHNLDVTEIESSDWGLSGGVVCNFASPGDSFIHDVYEQIIFGRMVEVGLPLCAKPGPGYLGPCPPTP